MWRFKAAVVKRPKSNFSSPYNLQSIFFLTSTNTIVNSSNDSRPEVSSKSSPKQNAFLQALKSGQESLVYLTSDLQPISSILTKPKNIVKNSTITSPIIDRDGYAVSSTLRAFVEACDVISDVPLALKSFHNIHSGIKKLDKKYKNGLNLDISLYHTLLRSVARRGNMKVIIK